MFTRILTGLAVLLAAGQLPAQVLEDYAAASTSSLSDPVNQGWTRSAVNDSPAIASWSSSPLAWILTDNNDQGGTTLGEYEYYYVSYTSDTNWIAARTDGWRIKATLRVDNIAGGYSIHASYAGGTAILFRMPALTIGGVNFPERRFDISFGRGNETSTSAPMVIWTAADASHLEINPPVNFGEFMDIELVFNPSTSTFRVYLDRSMMSSTSSVSDFTGGDTTFSGATRIIAWGTTSGAAQGVSYWKSLSAELFPYSPSVSVPISHMCRGGNYVVKPLFTGESGLSYQWKKNGTAISNGGRISGATSEQLTISGIRVSDDGVYTCDITRGSTVVTSESSTLTTCVADFNCDGFLDGFDYDAYVYAFENSMMPEADSNDDGFLDFFDYDLYVSSYESGCD